MLRGGCGRLTLIETLSGEDSVRGLRYMHRVTLFSDDLVHVHVRGEMRVDDQRAIHHLVTTLPGAPLRVLVTLEDFGGWEKSTAWNEAAGFLPEHGQRIARMALVGEERWREEALLFVGKGFRDTDIAYFPDDARRDAEEWLRRAPFSPGLPEGAGRATPSGSSVVRKPLG